MPILDSSVFVCHCMTFKGTQPTSAVVHVFTIIHKYVMRPRGQIPKLDQRLGPGEKHIF